MIAVFVSLGFLALCVLGALLSVSSIWFFVLPFSFLFSVRVRLAFLISAGFLFDLLSSHPVGIAILLFAAYGLLVSFFQRIVWGGIFSTSITLGIVSAFIPYAFVLVRAAEDMSYTLPYSLVFTQSVIHSASAAWIGAFAASLLTSFRRRRDSLYPIRL